MHEGGAPTPTKVPAVSLSGQRSSPVLNKPNPHALFWTRVLAGLVLAQGLYYGGRQLAVALLLAQGGAPALSASVLYVGQCLSGVLGALIAAAGQPRGVAAGMAVGAINAFVLLTTEVSILRTPLTLLALTGPFVQTLLGAGAAKLALRIWPTIQPLQFAAGKPKLTPPPRIKGPRVVWAQLLIGAAVGLVGTVAAGMLRDTVLITYDKGFQELATAEIAIFALLLGGMVAGMQTENGLAQGVLAGVLGGAALSTVAVWMGKLPAADFVLGVFGLPRTVMEQPVAIVAIVLASATVLCAGGGYFGAQLLPRPEAPEADALAVSAQPRQG
jgi:hypothetical protein